MDVKTLAEIKRMALAELDRIWPVSDVEIVDSKIENGRYTGTAVITHRWPAGVTMRVSEIADETPPDAAA